MTRLKQNGNSCVKKNDVKEGSSRRSKVETNPTRNHEAAVGSLTSLSGLRIWRCPELWCRSQTWLGSRVAVAVA